MSAPSKVPVWSGPLPYSLSSIIPPSGLQPPHPMPVTKKEISSLAQQCFDLMIRTLGEEGRSIWKEIAKKPRGRPKGSAKPEKDKRLLEIYDRYVPSPGRSGTLRRRIGTILGDPLLGGEYGHSANAVAVRLHRLLKKREEANK